MWYEQCGGLEVGGSKAKANNSSICQNMEKNYDEMVNESIL